MARDKPSGPKSGAQPGNAPDPTKAFSTTGRAGGDVEGKAEDSAGLEADERHAVVSLVRTDAALIQSIPERLSLGGGWPTAVTVGRHEDNEAVLPVRTASKLHCQVTLRAFRLSIQGSVHEAAFLRDNSRHGTLVNGFPAFRPWHWLQHGDVIGLMAKASTDVSCILNFYRVEYCKHEKLPGHMVTIEDIPARALAPSGALRRPPPPLLTKPYRGEICGRVVDVHYTDPPATYRMRIVSFDDETGWHRCDSAGLSTWDGDSFDDTIDLNTMYAEGNVKFVDELKEGGSKADGAEDDEAPLRRPPASKRRRKGIAKRG